MTIVTGDRYLESLVKFVENQAGLLIEGTLVLKLNPVGLHYVQSRLEALQELEGLLAGAPIDYLRAYVSDLGDHRALEQLRRILRLLPSLKVVSVLPHPARDPTPLPLLPFGRLRVLELRGCDLSTSAARGLLELRHTLEKIVCHNSTDALRHVFASRIAEIKDSPQWNRLSFVSCACNDLVLMDESLQLLPVVETVDLSRNRFAKVDNLRKCSRLKHLDLGFNQLRTVASFSEVSCHIVKLVLRNNALATLRGLENLKSLEGLDLSYNVISNFTELEILCSLPSMQNLWLEGNPLCCARWYRAQVFSYFNTLKVKLDEKEITKREYWKRQIIIASRQKRPASFGFYSPPQDDYEGGGSINRKQKKLSRLACIENREQSSFLCSDQEAASCDNDTKSRGETAVSDEEAEIVELMNRVELMKKERSVLWLREFKEWMDQPSEDLLDSHKYDSTDAEDYVKNKVRRRDLGESSRHVLDSVQASGDENSTNILESENSLPAKSAGMHGPLYFDQFGEAASSSSLRDTGKNSVPITGKMVLSPERLKSYQNEGINFNSVETKNLNSDIIAQAQMVDAELTPIDDFMESHSSCGCTGSPPHYEEDILHRRQNLVEEILQLSAESFSLASSESRTSESENDLSEFERSMSEDVVSTGENRHLHVSLSGDTYCDQRTEAVEENDKGKFMLDSHAGQASGHSKPLQSDDCLQLCINDLPAGLENGEAANFVDRYTNGVEREIRKRRPKKRVILLSDENNMIGKKTSVKLCGDLSSSRYRYNHEDGENLEFSGDSDFPPLTSFTTPTSDDAYGTLSVARQTSLVIDDFIQDYFNTNIGDPKVHEICRQYMCCECILERESKPKEREVAVLLSSEQKLYVLLIDIMRDASGTIPTLIGCHKVEEVQEVLVGVGLQVVRVYFEGNVTYLFITRNIEKSRQLISALDLMNASSNKYTLRSLEQIQVKSFEKLICGGSKKSILQYSLVLFFRNHGEELWLSRSLFVIGSHVLLCIEDFMQFGALSLDASSSPYFLLDSCCSITDVSEMVIETRESPCVTMALKHARSASSRTSETDEVKGIEGLDKEKAVSGSSTTWKIKWFSEDSLFKFVALMKAIHAGATIAPLLVKCI